MTDGAQPNRPASGATVAQLAPGARLGPYEIESVLGTGGQGPVYRGRDTRDGRAVAIKTSREPTGDGFARAARAMAALPHPHICQIYEAGPTYLAMELVEGETLAARIERGPFAIGPVLHYGAQMAGALAEAHAKGITHGNLTPGKIMITKAGVKILGFGLAGAATGPPANPAEPRGGASSDARTDIYALGQVLYEMATGRRAAESLAFDGLPEKFGHVVERCLAKEPGSRWQSAADVKAELEWAGRSSSLPALTSRQPQRALWAWGLAAILISAFVLETRFRQPPAAPPEMRLEMVTAATADPVSLAVSPDGLQVVFSAAYAGGSRLWLRPLGSGVAQPLAGTDNGRFPFWSRDSRSLGFFADGQLKRIDVDSGAVQTLARAESGRGGAWSRNGTIVFQPSPEPSALFRIPASGGAAVPLPQKGRFPQFLPGGQRFLFYSPDASGQQGIYVGQLDHPETRRVIDSDGAGVYTSTGHLLFLRKGTLFAQPFDVPSLTLSGAPAAVAEQVVVDGSVGAAPLSASQAGPIVYRAGTADAPRSSGDPVTGAAGPPLTVILNWKPK